MRMRYQEDEDFEKSKKLGTIYSRPGGVEVEIGSRICLLLLSQVNE